MLNVSKIQRMCVHDGPGIRTAVFFKGCALRCLWCQNPENLVPVPITDMSVTQIMHIVLRDKAYYKEAGGGITLTGGEPFLQERDSLVELLKAIKAEGIHISAETTLNAPYQNLEATLPYIDLFLVDLKAGGDTEVHKKLTGASDALIIENLKKLKAGGANIALRTVSVPRHNDGEEQIEKASAFIKSHGFDKIEVLKYYNAYEGKAKKLGLTVPELEITMEEAKASVERTVSLFIKHGIKAFYVEAGAPRPTAKFTDRVLKIRDDIRKAGRGLCVEADYLKTKYYTKNKGWKKPVAIHRAERLKYTLANKKLKVYDGELLVGNFTTKRSAGQLWAEQYGAVYATFIHNIEKQKPVNFECSWKEKAQFYFTIFPHWLRKGVLRRAHPTLKQFIGTMGRAAEMKVGFINNLSTIAHYIVNYERFLEKGTVGLASDIKAKQAESAENAQNTQYAGMLIALEALNVFADRYAEFLRAEAEKEADLGRKAELVAMAEVCAYVPRNPPRTYREALQSMLFLHIALCIEQYENAVSLGRLDQILYPYYKRDVDAGILTYEEAKELLALFILKLDEVIIVNDGDGPLHIGRNFETLSPDQALTFGGMGKDGKDATNDVTYMLLDICELTPLTANMTARVHKNSPEKYLRRIAEVYLSGSPMPELYSDDVQIATLLKNFPYTQEDARNYAIVGCVEPIGAVDHFGNTDAANICVAQPFLQALKGQDYDLWNRSRVEHFEKLWTKWVVYLERRAKHREFTQRRRERIFYKRDIRRGYFNYKPAESMEQLLSDFEKRLTATAQTILGDQQRIERMLQKYFTVPLCSTLYPGCVENGKDAYEGGATINSAGIQGVGITDTADSLYAISEVCFKNKLYTVAEVLEAMDANFEGEKGEKIREALLAVPKFGDDGDDESVFWVNTVMEIYGRALSACPYDSRKGKYVPGFYSLNVNDRYGRSTEALPSGRKKGVPFANGITPHYGSAGDNLLSDLNAIAKVNFTDLAVNGTSATLTIDPALFAGEEGEKNLSALFKTFLTTGGMEIQPNIVSREMLLEAYANPDKHRYLMVRIAGYCAYFQELSDELKKIIIDRTCYAG